MLSTCWVSVSGSSLRAVVAAGPFSTSEDLQYDPLRALLDKIRHDKPDVCILVNNCCRWKMYKFLYQI